MNDSGITLANVRAAAERAVVLGPVGIDVPSELEEARRVPLCGIGHDFCEEVLKPF